MQEYEDDQFDQLLERRSLISNDHSSEQSAKDLGSESSGGDSGQSSIILKEGEMAVQLAAPAGVVVSAQPLNEPRIYANKLLGKTVNTQDKIILKNQGGTITKIVKKGGAKDLTPDRNSTRIGASR